DAHESSQQGHRNCHPGIQLSFGFFDLSLSFFRLLVVFFYKLHWVRIHFDDTPSIENYLPGLTSCCLSLRGTIHLITLSGQEKIFVSRWFVDRLTCADGLKICRTFSSPSCYCAKFSFWRFSFFA